MALERVAVFDLPYRSLTLYDMDEMKRLQCATAHLTGTNNADTGAVRSHGCLSFVSIVLN